MRKMDIDSATLAGLSDVSDPDDSPSDRQDENEDKPDSKYCRISLFSNNKEEQDNLHNTKTVSNPTIYRIKNLLPKEVSSFVEYQTYVLKIIKEHVQKYGTINEIRFTGHGSREWMCSKPDSERNERISTISLLIALEQAEKDLKIKIANRIIFDACKTFVSLDDWKIKYYSEYAKEHKVQIVGTTSNTETLPVLGMYIHAGRYVQFSPSGKIIWDNLDAPYKAFILMTDRDKSWTDFYIDHTPDEGLTIKKAHEAQQTNDKKILERRENNGKSR